MCDDIVYLNINLTGEDSDTIAKTVSAESLISRSGVIVENASDYYVAVVRLRFTTNNPIIIAPCTSPQFAIDGVTTDWSLTVVYDDGAGNKSFGVGFIKLQKDNPILGQTSQPTDLYAAFWSPDEWVAAINEALAEANANCILNGGAVDARAPYVSFVPGNNGVLQLTVVPLTLWDQRVRPLATPFAELFTSWNAFNVFSGWSLKSETTPNAPLDPNGADWKFIIQSLGNNYNPPNTATAPEGITPTSAGPHSLTIPQRFPTQKLPGITKIAITSSLPIMQEFVPSANAKESRAVLTDFTPDTSNSMTGEPQSTLIYNAAVGDARWIKLKGGGPISTFTVRAETEDWLGRVRTYELAGTFAAFDIKLCFAPKRMVDNFRKNT